jgi:4-hydroxybenzoate polyprenyltransferase/phosphoserine phosphatase
LVVDLDGALVQSDLLYETFAAAFFRNPVKTLMVVARALFSGRAKLKQALCRLAPIELETLPWRVEVVAYLRAQKEQGRNLHLATAADESIAQAVAAHLGLFDRVYASDGECNLKGRAKAEVLAAAFPRGFSYVGDCRADLAVWRVAASAVVVAPRRLAEAAAEVTSLEHHFEDEPAGPKVWLAAARPHHWTKNLLVLVPTALGWPEATAAGVERTLAAFVLLCLVSSLTYVVNDVADVRSDRRHASKHRRPFAAGSLKLRDGLLAGGFGIPAVMAAAWLFVSPATVGYLLAYAVLTLGYSMGLKRTPLLDCMVISALFTLRLAIGVSAGALSWSPWLLTFSPTFFFSLAMAKRYTELLVNGATGAGQVHGRGFRYEDRPFILAFGVATATLSILIIVLYLMEEVFPAGAYRWPLALWAAPPILFLWVGRIRLLANRGEMHDDPVVFALRDRASLLLGAALAAAFSIAVV